MEHLTAMTDDQLVNLFISGQNAAFDTLLSRHQDRLYSFIRYYVRNADLADDLFQETFVKAIVSIRQQRYTGNGKFYAWLTRIAHNLLVDQFRNENNEQIVYNEEVEGASHASLLQAERDREDEMVREQVMVDVKKIMNHLPDAQREVVFMRFYQDMSFKEIAELKGISINTALGRMHYAIQNMRRMAKEYHISLSI